MKKILFLLIIITALAIWGFLKYRTEKTIPKTEPVSVQASAVQETSIPLEIHAIGTLVAHSVEISPEVAGHVQKILFQDGEFVKEGTTLVQLDDAMYKAQYESAKAKLLYFDGDFKRLSTLAKKSFVSKREIDKAETDLKEKIAETKQIQVTVDRMKLIAPFDGVTGKSKVNPGDYVTVGQSVVTLTDTQHLRIEYNVPEKFLALLKKGQVVKVISPAYPDQEFFGNLSFISPTINTENRSVSLYADILNPKNLLVAGMFVNVLHSLGKDTSVLVIPARSLVPILDGVQVYKIVDGKAYAVNVLAGKRNKENVQIIHGLSKGDMIITDGQLKVKDGVVVRPQSKS